VTNYASAVEHGYIGIGARWGLYKYAKAVTRINDEWDHWIKVLLDLSKAARTLSAAALLAAIAELLGWVDISPAFWRQMLTPLHLATGSLVLFVLGFAFRVAHQLTLYDELPGKAMHVRLLNGEIMLLGVTRSFSAPAVKHSPQSTVGHSEPGGKRQ
jgi:hypothetical protein